MWSGYNNTRKDPDTLMELSSLFLKLTGLSRNDIKKVLLLQDGRGDVRSFLKVTNPDISGLCRKCNLESEIVGHMLGGCIILPSRSSKREMMKW